MQQKMKLPAFHHALWASKGQDLIMLADQMRSPLHGKSQGIVEIVAISNIKAGEEITISYTDSHICEMRKKKMRQENLLNTKYFVCSCNLCQEEEDDNDDTIEELFEEIENLNSLEPDEWKHWPSRRQIECYKELYRHGKAKKVHPMGLFCILKEGFASAVAGYVHNRTEEFKIEAENFAKTADKFDKFVGSQVVTHGHGRPDFWKQRYQNFEQWVRLYIQVAEQGNIMCYYERKEENGVNVFHCFHD